VSAQELPRAIHTEGEYRRCIARVEELVHREKRSAAETFSNSYRFSQNVTSRSAIRSPRRIRWML